MLVDGKWDAEWQPVQAADAKGRFVRQDSVFRDWITPDGTPGPEGQNALPAAAGRYHLIVAYICPWASRTLMARALKGLEEVISISVVDPRLSDQGWKFGDFPGSNPNDELIGTTHMHGFYTHSDPHVSGRATVPVLWDKQSNRIVNNESADILRILNSGFSKFSSTGVDLYPEAMRADIDALNIQLYDNLNNGVYKAGFASTQFAYEEANDQIIAMLDKLEDLLSDGRRFLLGDAITEADLRAFVTLIRFDAAYVGLFKTNRRRIADYPNLQRFLKTTLDIPGIRDTVRIDHIKAGYYSIKSLNPSGIVPAGPDLSELGF